jgi:hypothetical protein
MIASRSLISPFRSTTGEKLLNPLAIIRKFGLAYRLLA